MIRRPPRSTLFPTRRSSDLCAAIRNSRPYCLMHRVRNHGSKDCVVRVRQPAETATFASHIGSGGNEGLLRANTSVVCVKPFICCQSRQIFPAIPKSAGGRGCDVIVFFERLFQEPFDTI